MLSDFFIKHFGFSIVLFCAMFIWSEFINFGEDWKNNSEQEKYINDIKALNNDIKILEKDCDKAKSRTEEVGLYLESLPPAFFEKCINISWNEKSW